MPISSTSSADLPDPLSQRGAAIGAVASDAPDARGNQTIAVIDDDPISREFITSALQLAHFATIEADDGQRGAALCIEKIPDVIILDVVMAGMTGYDTIVAFRQNPATSSIPIILMTAAADRRGMRHGMVLGADDFLQKPFSADEVVAAVQAQLKKKATVRSQAESALRELQGNMMLAFPHELNTPLNGIIGCAELLSESSDPAEVPVLARCILDSAHRLQRQSDRFLRFVGVHLFLQSSEQEGRIVGDRECDNPRECITAATLAAAKRFQREADVTLACMAQRAPISGPNLSFIVDELVDNALKFSPAHSKICITHLMSESAVVLRVDDAGRGMKQDQISRIGPFVQFERAKFAHEGLGLGLATVRQLVKLHRGELTISPSPLGGCSVEIRLPLPETAS